MNDSQRIGKLLSDARYQAGKSQEFMALELGVSKNTVLNWEKGTSSPKMNQFFKWFSVLGINIHRPLMNFLYPDTIDNLSSQNSDQEIVDAIVENISWSTPKFQREIAYILLGEHGSNPASLLNLFTAYLHLPMHYRIAIAQSIMDDYDICNHRNELVQTDHVMPDEELIKKSIALGKKAAIDGDTGYSINM